MKNRLTTRPMGTVVTTALVALTLAMAGCAGLGGAKESAEANKSPEAILTSSKNVAWTSEGLSFDGSDSKDPDGNVEQWVFDFGDDSTPHTAKREEDAHPSHVYLKGGEYTVTLTVIDDGGESSGAKSDLTTKQVAINERVLVPETPVVSAPTGNENSTVRVPFTVNEDADRISVDLDVQSLVAAGSTEMEFRLLDQNGDEIANEEVTIDAGDTENVQLEDVTLMDDDTGAYNLEMISHSGAASVDGDIEVYYDAGYTSG